MFLIVPVLILSLASVNVQSKRSLPAHNVLPQEMKATFQKVNERYNEDMKWGEGLAKKAETEAITPNNTNSRWILKVQGTDGTIDNTANLEDKVEKVLNRKLEKEGLGWNVTKLPSGTKYGCGGFVNMMGPKGDPILQVACVYTVKGLV